MLTFSSGFEERFGHSETETPSAPGDGVDAAFEVEFTEPRLRAWVLDVGRTRLDVVGLLWCL